MWEQQVDEAFGSGLRFVVGQADAFIGFNEHVFGLIGGLDHQIEADHGNIESAGGAHSGINQLRVQALSDVLQASTGVQIGGAPYSQALARR
ncbi:hypothetical protein D3C79_664700 [compost metagenome]